MLENGVVIELRGENALVRFERSAACGKCGACMAAGKNEMQVQVPNALGAQEGERVTVAIPTRSFFEAAFLMYIVPLCALLAGLFIAKGLGAGDTLAVFAALGAALLVFGILRLLDPIFLRSKRFAPKMTALHRPEEG